MNSFIYSNYLFSFFDDSQNNVQIGNGSHTIYHNACEICPKHIVIPSFAYNQKSEKYKVTIVSKHAFSHCESSETIYIPKTIIIISDCAFLTIYASNIIFEAGSQLKEIKSFGFGWITASTFVLPPGVEILHENSLRGFDRTRNLYYCGTYTFDIINVFTTTDEGTLNVKIHVTENFNSNVFGNFKVFDHKLNCNIPLICSYKMIKHILLMNICILLLFPIIILKS